MKILLGQLISNGDCLMATVIAKQIKKDFPGCHLTWAISDRCRQMIENNPDIDKIWEVKLSSMKAALNEDWHQFRDIAEQNKKAGEFDETFFTQIYPDNVYRFDGTTRGTMYNSYPNKITVEARPVLRLKDEEKERIARFVQDHGLQNYQHVILFECTSFSGQSFVDAGWAMAVSRSLVSANKDVLVIISTHEKLLSPHQQIIIGNGLSLRENAGLTHYCTLLAGCSSGITWMATTDEAKRLPMVQFLKRGMGFSFASVAYDHRYWGLDDSLILETTNPGIEEAVELISFVLEKGIGEGRKKYHEKLKPSFLYMLKYSFRFFRKGKIGRSLGVIKNFVKRNYFQQKKHS